MTGDPITEIRDDAIPLSVVQALHNLCVTNNWTMEDVVTYNNNNNNNKSIYIAPILFSAKRFTMQEKDLVKK